MAPGACTSSWSGTAATRPDGSAALAEPPRRRQPGQPSEQDLALWRWLTRDTQPLRRRTPEPPPPAPEALEQPSEKAALRGSTAPAAVAPPPTPAPPLVPPVAPAPPRPPPELVHGSLAGLDKRKAQRLRRGRLPIEARLDLHGLTRAEAHGALTGFVCRSAALGRRCVLVITGKGRGPGEAAGVLRRELPHWLNQPGLREKVLAFDYARPEHGGEGAIYLLLRRSREEVAP